MNIDIETALECIKRRHHAFERFYDIKLAKDDLKQNLSSLQKIKLGVSSRDDEMLILDIMNEYV